MRWHPLQAAGTKAWIICIPGVIRKEREIGHTVDETEMSKEWVLTGFLLLYVDQSTAEQTQSRSGRLG